MPSKVHCLYRFICTAIFFSPDMDLQCSKCKIVLKIDDFVLLSFIWPKCWPFLQFSEHLRSIYAFQCAFLVLVCSHHHFCRPFMELQCSKWQIGLKINDFVFLTFILLKFGPKLRLRNVTERRFFKLEMVSIIVQLI